MLRKNMRKKEIEERLEGLDTFVQIGHLEYYLKQMPPIDMRKFAYIKLAKIYLDRGMFGEAARSFHNASQNSLTFREKIELGLKEAKAHILDGKYDEADRAIRRAMSEANMKQKQELFKEYINFLKKRGEELIKQGKNAKASKLYEKLIRMRISDDEKAEVKEILLDLYDKLGKRKEYNFLKGLNYF